MRAERKLDFGDQRQPRARSHIEPRSVSARGAGSELEWDQDESTTQVWTDSRALRAIHVSSRTERARTVPPPPPPRAPSPSAYPSPYAMVANAPLPMPALSLAPVTLELEQPEAGVPWVWSLVGAAGLFSSVLLMHVLIAPVAVPAMNVASSPVRTDAEAAPVVEARHGDPTPRAVEPEAAAPSDLRKAIPVSPPAASSLHGANTHPPDTSTHAADTSMPPRPTTPARVPQVANVTHEHKPAAAARPLTATVAARPKGEPHAGKAAPVRQPIAPVAPATTPAEPRAVGTLRVNSLPWAEVYIDDVFVGTTPRSDLSVKAGRHRLKLVNRPLEMEKTLVVEIRPAQVVTKIVNLSP